MSRIVGFACIEGVDPARALCAADARIWRADVALSGRISIISRDGVAAVAFAVDPIDSTADLTRVANLGALTARPETETENGVTVVTALALMRRDGAGTAWRSGTPRSRKSSKRAIRASRARDDAPRDLCDAGSVRPPGCHSNRGHRRRHHQVRRHHLSPMGHRCARNTSELPRWLAGGTDRDRLHPHDGASSSGAHVGLTSVVRNAINLTLVVRGVGGSNLRAQGGGNRVGCHAHIFSWAGISSQVE